ncbi:MAG: hypothetical protein IPI84_08760 [Holophagaceae bacterium]|nr:hypothetical protein [Holophagaceae bacterium]
MRKILAVLVCLATQPAIRAQSEAWNAYLESWKRTPRGALNLLLSSAAPLGSHRASDEVFLQLVSARDVALEVLEGGELERVTSARGWDRGSRWILLDARGRTLLEGSALPTGEALRSQLLTLGRTPTWEALEQFLRSHPDSGDALQRRLGIAYRMSVARFRSLRTAGKGEGFTAATDSRFPIFKPATVMDPQAARGISREVLDTLHRLNQLPDAWRVERGMFSFWLNSMGSLDPLALHDELLTFRDVLLPVWQANPHTGGGQSAAGNYGLGGLAGLWLSCRFQGADAFDLSEVTYLRPSPGRPWPSPDLVNQISIEAIERHRTGELLAFLDRIALEDQSGTPQGDHWREWVDLRRVVWAWRAVALAERDRWTDFAMALRECWKWSGPEWSAMASGFKEIYRKKARPGQVQKAESAQDVVIAGALEILDQPPMDLPKAPGRPEPLRHLVWGHPSWMTRWPLLRATVLAPWGPDELLEQKPTEADETWLAKAGLRIPRWAVFQGNSVVVSHGEEAPDPVRLVLELQAVAPSRLQILDAFIRRNPEHLDARRDRFGLLRSRMPSPTLEGRLREDGAKTQMALDFGPEAEWISDLAGWQDLARRVVPDLEAALRRWPSDRTLWQAWVSWSAFLPNPPSVVGFADSLPIFGPRSNWKLGLPAVALRAAVADFRKGRRFDAMADWFQDAWSEIVTGVPDQTGSTPVASEAEEAIVQGYREALKHLGREAELLEADRRWRGVRSRPSGKGA